ncbi:MAG: 50S ribosomal protein L17 [Planctomyces sp.]|nr:50S ribosomal protein L17 [Planctomyces sp.]
MRHRIKGRILGRTGTHRRAMFRNMAASLIRTLGEFAADDRKKPKVAGRIITTVPKAKELRPFVERLVTIAKSALPHEERAEEFATSAERNSPEWKSWRESDRWQKWNAAIAPAVTARRRAFAQLRDKEAVSLLFSVVAPRFKDRQGGYLRIVRIAERRLGDGGEQAIVEFVGVRDRPSRSRKAPEVVGASSAAEPATADA